MNADFDIHFNILTLVGLAGVCAAAVMAYRRGVSSREPDVDVAEPLETSGYSGLDRRAPLLDPDAAPKSATGKARRGLLALAEFLGAVDAAIPASLQQSRSVGVLYIRCALDCQDKMMRAAVLNIAGDAILKAFRPTDPIMRLDGSDFVVALPMLADRRHIAAIEERLRQVTDETVVTTGFSIAAMTGSAMYPINGYSAEALVASARENMRYDTVDANGQRVRIKPKTLAAPVPGLGGLAAA